MWLLSGNAELCNMAGTPLALECVIKFLFLCSEISVVFICSTVVLRIFGGYFLLLLGTVLDYECLVGL